MKTDISFSRWALFLKCEQSYVFKYVAKKSGLGRSKGSLDGIHKHESLSKRVAYEYGLDYKRERPIKSSYEEAKAAKEVENFDLYSAIGRKKEVLGIESEFRAPLNDDFDIVGTMDLILRDKEGNIEVIDWKTGRAVSNPADDDQGIFYAFLIMEIFPNVKEVTFTKYFVKYNDPRSYTYTYEEAQQFKEHLLLLSPEIKRLHYDPDTAFETIGTRCVGCQHIHVCQAAAGNIPTDVTDLADEINFLEAKLSFYKESMKEYVSQEGADVIIDDNRGYSCNSSISHSVHKSSAVGKDEVLETILKDPVLLSVAKEEGLLSISFSNTLKRHIENKVPDVKFSTTTRVSLSKMKKGAIKKCLLDQEILNSEKNLVK